MAAPIPQVKSARMDSESGDGDTDTGVDEVIRTGVARQERGSTDARLQLRRRILFEKNSPFLRSCAASLTRYPRSRRRRDRDDSALPTWAARPTARGRRARSPDPEPTRDVGPTLMNGGAPRRRDPSTARITVARPMAPRRPARTGRSWLTLRPSAPYRSGARVDPVPPPTASTTHRRAAPRWPVPPSRRKTS